MNDKPLPRPASNESLNSDGGTSVSVLLFSGGKTVYYLPPHAVCGDVKPACILMRGAIVDLRKVWQQCQKEKNWILLILLLVRKLTITKNKKYKPFKGRLVWLRTVSSPCTSLGFLFAVYQECSAAAAESLLNPDSNSWVRVFLFPFSCPASMWFSWASLLVYTPASTSITSTPVQHQLPALQREKPDSPAQRWIWLTELPGSLLELFQPTYCALKKKYSHREIMQTA